MKNKSFFRIGLIYFIAMIGIATLFVLGSFGLIQNEFLATFLIQVIVMFGVPFLMYTLFVSKSAKKTLEHTGFSKFSYKMFLISVLLGIALYFINTFVATFFCIICVLGETAHCSGKNEPLWV